MNCKLPISAFLPLVAFLSIGCDDKSASNRPNEEADTSVRRPIVNPEHRDNSRNSYHNSNVIISGATLSVIEEKARSSSPDWSSVLKSANGDYTGKDLDAFLHAYADAHASETNFDRLGFIEGLKALKGPGTSFSSILSLIYSGPVKITPKQLMAEINQIDLTDFERDVFIASVVTSPVLSNSTLEQLVDIYGTEKDPKLAPAIASLLQERIYKQLQDKTPSEISSLIQQNASLRNLNISNVVDRSAQDKPKVWWDGFVSYCNDSNTPNFEMYKKYGQAMIEGFLLEKTPTAILDQVGSSADKSFQGTIAEGVAARWAASDANEVAQWVASEPPGYLRDVVALQLSLRLDATGLKSEASDWAQTVRDEKIVAKLKARGILNK